MQSYELFPSGGCIGLGKRWGSYPWCTCEEKLAGNSHTSRSPSQGLDRRQQNLEAVFAVRELLCLKDTALLSLEVLGFITKYPDVR